MRPTLHSQSASIVRSGTCPKLTVYILIFTLSIAPCYAQIYFNNVYADTSHYSDNATNVVVLEDGSFLVPSVATPSQGPMMMSYNMRHLSESGEQLSSDTVFDYQGSVIYANFAESFIEVSDGGFLQASYKNGAYLLKLNSDLSIAWEVRVDSLDSFYRSIELSNGNYFTCGYTYGLPNQINLYWISPMGEVIRHGYVVPFEASDFYNILRVQELPNGDLILCGVYTPSLDGNQFMAIFDSIGNLIWRKVWNHDYNDWVVLSELESEDEATVLFGNIDYVLDPNDMWHDNFHGRLGTMKVDLSTGDSSDVILYPQEHTFFWVTDFTKTPDNGYATLAIANEVGTNYTFIYKLDENRQLEWYQKYLYIPYEEDSTQICQGYDIEAMPDSGFVVAGTYWSWGKNISQMPWAFRTDKCGELVWNNCGTVSSGTEPPSLSGLVEVYPNPARGEVTVSSSNPFLDIRVFDLSGREVYRSNASGPTSQLTLNLPNLSSGLYFLETAHTSGKRSSSRLVVE